jgi:hypothetical protein
MSHLHIGIGPLPNRALERTPPVRGYAAAPGRQVTAFRLASQDQRLSSSFTPSADH